MGGGVRHRMWLGDQDCTSVTVCGEAHVCTEAIYTRGLVNAEGRGQSLVVFFKSHPLCFFVSRVCVCVCVHYRVWIPLEEELQEVVIHLVGAGNGAGVLGESSQVMPASSPKVPMIN